MSRCFFGAAHPEKEEKVRWAIRGKETSLELRFPPRSASFGEQSQPGLVEKGREKPVPKSYDRRQEKPNNARRWCLSEGMRTSPTVVFFSIYSRGI